MTRAFDLFRVGNEKVSVGLTAFEKKQARINPVEVSLPGGFNPNARISEHIGVNIAQVRTPGLSFDLNGLTCSATCGVSGLLSGINPSCEAQCAVVDAIVTVPKVEILCVANKCLEMEASASFKAGTVKVSRDNAGKVEEQLGSSVTIEGECNLKIIDRPKKNP